MGSMEYVHFRGAKVYEPLTFAAEEFIVEH
jgi:hypothetical protein